MPELNATSCSSPPQAAVPSLDRTNLPESNKTISQTSFLASCVLTALLCSSIAVTSWCDICSPVAKKTQNNLTDILVSHPPWDSEVKVHFLLCRERRTKTCPIPSGTATHLRSHVFNSIRPRGVEEGGWGWGAVYWPSVCRAPPPPPPTRGAPHAQDVAEALFSANASNHTT